MRTPMFPALLSGIAIAGALLPSEYGSPAWSAILSGLAVFFGLVAIIAAIEDASESHAPSKQLEIK